MHPPDNFLSNVIIIPILTKALIKISMCLTTVHYQDDSFEQKSFRCFGDKFTLIARAGHYRDTGITNVSAIQVF